MLDWPGGPPGGQTLLTPHYALHTTVKDPAFLRQLARTMEDSYRLYAELAPQSDRLHGHVYARREEWADYTQQSAGPLAPVYLQIHRGGYAHGNLFATFHHGDRQTLAVCRHEGWHQYVASRFARRLPPFVEEAVATLFEEGFEAGDVARPLPNGTRQLRLAEAVRRGHVWPLRTLLEMHAGDVIGSDAAQIDTFYAQAWALALFVLQRDAYRDGFRRMLVAYADGSVAAQEPVSAFERYLGLPFERIEADYVRYVRELAGVAPNDP